MHNLSFQKACFSSIDIENSGRLDILFPFFVLNHSLLGLSLFHREEGVAVSWPRISYEIEFNFSMETA
jgi:hypothetical protein